MEKKTEFTKCDGISIGFQNVNGINDYEKRTKVEDTLKSLNLDLIVLLDTRLGKVRQRKQLQMDQWKPYFAGNESGKRGIKVLLKPSSSFVVKKFESDTEGNYIILECVIQDVPTLVVGTYGPNDDKEDWWADLQTKIESKGYLHVILAGDINLVIDPDMDCKGYSHIWFPKKRKLINDWMANDTYIDTFRDLYPDKREYSWTPYTDDQVKKGKKQSRIDVIFTSPTMLSYVTDMKYEKQYIGLDHKVAIINFDYLGFKAGKGSFRTPPHLVKDDVYCKLIIGAIKHAFNDSSIEPVPNEWYTISQPQNII